MVDRDALKQQVCDEVDRRAELLLDASHRIHSHPELSGNEFRTAPLWGLSKRKFFLHDGRATTLVDAVRAHGGEALPSKLRAAALSSNDQSALLAFLGSL